MVTWNESDKGSEIILDDTKLVATRDSVRDMCSIRATKGVDNGKFYFEITPVFSNYQTHISVGISNKNFSVEISSSGMLGVDKNGIGYTADGQKYYNGVFETGLRQIQSNETIGVGIDMINQDISFYDKDGMILIRNISEICSGGAVYPTVSMLSASLKANFGDSKFVLGIPRGFVAYKDEYKIEVTPLSIYKTLKDNLPMSITNEQTEIHFTEDGGIYINDKDGSLVQCNTGDIVREISNPLTTAPLEYGYYSYSEDATFEGLENEVLKFNKNSGNIPIQDGFIHLKAGKTYHIMFSVVVDNENELGGGHIKLFDKTNDIELKRITVLRAGEKFNHNALSTNDIMFTPDIDTDICLLTGYIGTTKVYSKYTSLSVQEIRSNPVNQYGGFETEVLFDGEITIGEYELNGNVDDYNFVIMETFADDEYNDITPIMISDTEPYPYIASASSVWDSKFQAWKAFDNKFVLNANEWASANDSGKGWLKLDFSKPTKCNGFNIVSRDERSDTIAYPKIFSIQGSNDDIEWDVLGNFSTSTWNPNELKSFYFDNESKYRFYKIDVTESSYDKYVCISELRFLEKTEERIVTKTQLLLLNNYNWFDIDGRKISFDKNKINIIANTSNIRINRITGVKGQIPSLLVGGEF